MQVCEAPFRPSLRSLEKRMKGRFHITPESVDWWWMWPFDQQDVTADSNVRVYLTDREKPLFVQFACDADRKDFFRVVGHKNSGTIRLNLTCEEFTCRACTNPKNQRVTKKLLSIWYPYKKPNRYADQDWHQDWEQNPEPINPRYPVYVISKGRWATPHTARALTMMKVPFTIVVERQEARAYRAQFKKEKLKGRILVVPNFSKQGKGSIPVRNFVWRDAIKTAGIQGRHWLMDDNIPAFFRLHENVSRIVRTGLIFAAVEDFAERYENVAFAGLQNSQFCKAKNIHPPLIWGTRVYSCTLIKNDLDLSMPAYEGINHLGEIVQVPACPEPRWRGLYNEDTDLMLRALKKGYGTVLFVAVHADKEPTMKMKGGNTDELYAGDPKSIESGRYRMAQSIADQHPDVARIAQRFNRWQHVVDYPRAGLDSNKKPLWNRKFVNGVPPQEGFNPRYAMVLKPREKKS